MQPWTPNMKHATDEVVPRPSRAIALWPQSQPSDGGVRLRASHGGRVWSVRIGYSLNHPMPIQLDARRSCRLPVVANLAIAGRARCDRNAGLAATFGNAIRRAVSFASEASAEDPVFRK